MDIKDINKLTDKSGVYLFKDIDKTIIYIGKSKNLKKRVKSYFTKNHSDQKTQVLVENIKSLDFIVTSSEVEALILEANLIKKHRPRFNIDLKDNKTYPFIKVTLNEIFPRVIKTRKFKNDGSKYFGPYAKVSAVYNSLEIIQRLFKVRTCNKKITGKTKITPCLNYHIGRCSGACTKGISKEDYRKNIDDVMVFLSGKFDKLIKILKTKMNEASDELLFEKAAYYRDQLNFVKEINEKQKVYTPDKKDRDVIGFYEGVDKYYYLILFFREGKLLGKQAFSSVNNDEKERALSDLLMQYYEDNNIPDEILLPHEIDDFLLISQTLNNKRSTKFIYPKIGIKKDILNMASSNAKYEFLKERKLTEKEGILLELKEALGMELIPRRIECFDISNTDGILAVGSMVSFFNGKEDKKNYRIFKIRDTKGPDDVSMIKEVVSRRYTRIINENLALPDLVVIDGGKGQVNGAASILKALELSDLFVIGLAKKEEEIVFADKKEHLRLPKNSEALRLLQRIRDEAHRFGITFHKKLRDKGVRFSILDEVKGVGEKKKIKLLSHFKSIERLSNASEEEIFESGIDKRTSKEIYSFFHSEK